MKGKQKKQLRWTFIPSQRTLQLYDARIKQLAMPINKSRYIDALVSLGIEREMQGAKGGIPAQVK